MKLMLGSPPGLAAAAALFALVAAGDASAHSEHLPAAPAPAADGGSALAVEVALDASGAAPVVEVPRGARVRLTLTGAGGRELHLHGFDIEARAPAGSPVVFTFEAAHSGRFPMVAHAEDALLGTTERALLYVEVRAR